MTMSTVDCAHAPGAGRACGPGSRCARLTVTTASSMACFVDGANGVTPIASPLPKRWRPGRPMVMAIRTLQAIRRHDRVVLFSSRGRVHPELLVSAALGALRVRPDGIVLAGEMWEPDSGPAGWLERRVVRAADRVVRGYVVHCEDDARLLSDAWGVDPARVRVSPHHVDPDLPPLRPWDPVAPVLAGGNSFRDYGPLLEAAEACPEVPFLVATGLRMPRSVPPNVEVRQLGHHGFLDALAGCSVCVVPIQGGLRRSAGLLTYLNAMAAGRPAVVREAPGVAQHIDHGRTGLVVDGTAAGYVDAIRWCLDPGHRAAVERMTAQARDAVAPLTLAHHRRAMLDAVDDLLEGRNGDGR
jgi:glycosyltransferase involved in cell wall biosynthesis